MEKFEHFRCPFCGSEGLTSEYDSFGTTIYCDDGCHGQFNFPAFEDEVLEMWENTMRNKNFVKINFKLKNTPPEIQKALDENILDLL